MADFGSYDMPLWYETGGKKEHLTVLLEEGKSLGISACGLGSRNSLRAGTCLPLSHQDIGHYNFMNHHLDFAFHYTAEKSRFT